MSAKFYEDIIELRDEFLNLCAHIAANLSVEISEVAVAKLLMDSVCERFVIEKLRSIDTDVEKMERICLNLHEYAVSLLIERLKNTILMNGFSVALLNEANSLTGRYDVVIVMDRGRVQIFNGKGSISLGVKTGLNISLNQLEKYLENFLNRFSKLTGFNLENASTDTLISSFDGFGFGVSLSFLCSLILFS